MLVQAGERAAVLGDGFIVPAVARELLGIALTARDVAGDASFVLVAAQIGAGSIAFLKPRAVRCAVRLRKRSGMISTAI